MRCGAGTAAGIRQLSASSRASSSYPVWWATIASSRSWRISVENDHPRDGDQLIAYLRIQVIPLSRVNCPLPHACPSHVRRIRTPTASSRLRTVPAVVPYFLAILARDHPCRYSSAAAGTSPGTRAKGVVSTPWARKCLPTVVR